MSFQRNPGAGAQLALHVPDELVDAIARRVVELMGAVEQKADASELLTVDEAAAHLRCKRQRVYDLTSAGRLEVVKEGTRSLYRRADLDAHLAGASR